MKTAAMLISLLALTVPAAAQNAEPPKPAPCQAEPQANTQQDQDKKKPTENGGDESTAQKLAPCGGVLKPPPTGDSEMTAPAPDEGKTPVIKPGDVPPQPPKQD